MSLALTAERDFAGHQAIGQRAQQEDAYVFSDILAAAGEPAGMLTVVADGMGGHAAGNLASQVAARAFAKAFGNPETTVAERFRHALKAANEALAAAIEADLDNLEGMGTTLVAAAITARGLEWVSVGDSPLYLFRAGGLRRGNADHSFRPMLQEMVQSGELSPEQASFSALKNRLRSALVGSDIALTDQSSAPIPLMEGDIIVAASDGLQTLTDAQIAAVLRRHPGTNASALAIRLLQAVFEAAAPKQDNITITVLKPPAGWLRPASGPGTAK